MRISILQLCLDYNLEPKSDLLAVLSDLKSHYIEAASTGNVDRLRKLVEFDERLNPLSPYKIGIQDKSGKMIEKTLFSDFRTIHFENKVILEAAIENNQLAAIEFIQTFGSSEKTPFYLRHPLVVAVRESNLENTIQQLTHLGDCSPEVLRYALNLALYLKSPYIIQELLKNQNILEYTDAKALLANELSIYLNADNSLLEEIVIHSSENSESSLIYSTNTEGASMSESAELLNSSLETPRSICTLQ